MNIGETERIFEVEPVEEPIPLPMHTEPVPVEAPDAEPATVPGPERVPTPA